MTSRRHCAQSKRDIFQLPDGCYSSDRLKMKMLCMFHSGKSYESSALSRHVKIALSSTWSSFLLFLFFLWKHFSVENLRMWRKSSGWYICAVSECQGEFDMREGCNGWEKSLFNASTTTRVESFVDWHSTSENCFFAVCVAKWGKCWRSWTAVAVIVHLRIRRYRAFQSVQDVSENESESETN